MKKAAFFPLAALILCLLLTMTACGQKKDVTVEQLMEANTNEKLFEQYDSVLFLQEYSYGEIMAYRTKDFKCYSSGDDYYEAYLDGRYYCSDTQGCYAAIGCFPMSVPLDEPLIFNEYLTRSETPVDVKEDGEHLLMTTTVAPEMVAETMEYFNFEYVEGASISYEYILDAQTLLVRQCDMSISDGEGNQIGSCHITLMTEAEMPEQIETLYNRLTAENQKELTIVLNPGTEEEEAYNARFVDGDEVYVALPEGYTTFYTDAECTEILSSCDGSAFIDRDGTLYSVKGE